MSWRALATAILSLTLAVVGYAQEVDTSEKVEALLQWQLGDPNWESPAVEYDRLISDRPHVSEATALVGVGRAQLETGYSYFLDKQSGTTTETHSFPEPLLRVGMLAEWFELRLGYNYIAQYDRTAGGPRIGTSGSDDMYLGAKVALAKQVGILPDLTLIPQMRIPTGSRSITNGQVMPGLNVAYSWAVNSFIELECNSVFNRRLDGTGHYAAEYLQTANLEYDLGEKLMGFTEYLLFTPISSTDAAHQHYFHGGIQYFVTPDFQIDLHSAVGLNSAATDLAFSGIGFCFRH
jgi:hypothetical protein